MSQIADSGLEQLREVAYDLRETFDERGHSIERAIEIDQSFGRYGRGALRRDLATDTVMRKASQIGLDPRIVQGGGCEFRLNTGGMFIRLRLRSARLSADGTPIVLSNSESALADESELFREEHWVFGMIYGPDDNTHRIHRAFAAEVTGFREGSPGRLILGPVHWLLDGSDDLSSISFTPDDEDLAMPGIDDEPDESEGTSRE